MSSSIIFLTFCILSVVLATEYNKYGGHHHSYYQPLKVKTYGSGYHESYGKDYHSEKKPESYYHYEPKYEDYHKKEPSYTPYYGSSYNHHDDDYSKPEYYGSKYEQPKYEEYHGAHDDHYYGAEHH
ncbi:unnamed protein product [Caenorhabditis angaria]|uniref:Uncharacterized protein n=1 Tax=Caenorhabditis angaria TaxID=860376 RepID=A0A9P1I667_9PELO|nr:unnamed protein product [Caenorhabditis angaria]